MELFKEKIAQYLSVSDEDLPILAAYLQPAYFQAKQTIIYAGQVANKMYFIRKGLVRTFMLHDGKEFNTYFAADGQFVTIYTSFIGQTPSSEFMEAIEETEVFFMTFDKLTNLYKTHPKFSELGRILAEQNYLCTVSRTLAMQTKSAKEKYLDFLENYDKKIVQRVPMLHIASFLGIAPESLSRIRKELAIS